MILALDVYYYETDQNSFGAKSVGILFENWNDTKPKETIKPSIKKKK